MTFRPLPSSFRRFASSALTNRKRAYDVMAKYRRPSISLSQIQSETFETASTSPAASSFQDVPPPDTLQGVRKATALPAMQPVGPDPAVKEKEEGKEIEVEGVVIPPRPRPPTDEECCMSGCVHCVYNIYADDLEIYTTALESARKALIAADRPEASWPEPVRRVEKKGAEGVKDEEKGKVTDGMDPVMSAFLAMENKLKRKQVASRGSTAGAG